MALSLTACGKSQNSSEELLKDFDASTLEALAEAGAFSEELEELDADMAFALYGLANYGLEREGLENAVVLRSAGATCEEAAVLTFENEEQTDIALAALKDYQESQIESNQSYRPQEIPKLENAVLMVRKTAILFLIAADLDAAVKVVAGTARSIGVEVVE